MGETYRGLTIRIGGDTTSLQKALKSVNHDAGNLSNVLRKASQALRIDPYSIRAGQIRLDLLSQSAQNSFAKMNILRGAYEQKLNSSEFQKAKKYVEESGDSAGMAAERYNKLDTQLEKVKRSMAELQGVDLKEDGAYSAWNRNFSANLASLRKSGGADAHALLSQYDSIAPMHAIEQERLSMTKQVAEFRDLEAEMEKTRAKAVQFAEQYVDMYRQMANVNHLEGMEETRQQLDRADRAASELDKRLAKVNAALKLDPSNVTLLATRFELLQQKEEAAKKKIEALEQQLNKLKSSGIDGVAASTEKSAYKVEELHDKWKKVSKDLAEAKSDVDTLSDAMRKLEDDGKVGKEYEELSKQLDEAKGKVTALAAEEEKAATAFKGAQGASEIERVESELEEARSAAKKFEDEMTRVESTTQSASKKAGESVHSIAYTLQNLGWTFSATVTPYIAIAAHSAIESADDIDGAYRDMRKTVDGTEEGFEQLKAAAEDFARTHVTSSDQMLEIEALGGQLGIAQSNLKDFSEVVSNIEVSTNLDAETAATDMGHLAAITHMTSDEYSNFADVLVRLGNNSATQESDIMDIVTRIGSVGTICGFTLPQLTALSAALSSTGQNSEAAGTALSNTFSELETAVANGGDQLEALAEVSRMSADEFADSWNNRPIEAFTAFINGLREIDESGGSVDATLEGLGITAVRQKQAIEGLVQESKTTIDAEGNSVNVLNDALAMSEDAWNGVSDSWGQAGDAANEANKKAEGFSGQLAILQNNAQILGSEFGESLLPIMKYASGAIEGVTNAISGMSDEQKQAIVVAVATAGALGPVLTTVGALKSAAASVNATTNAARTSAVLNIEALRKQVQVMKEAGEPASRIATAEAELALAEKNQAKTAKTATTATKGLTAAQKGLALAGAAAVAIIAALAIKGIMDWNEKCQKARESTNLMKSAIKATTDMMGNVRPAADDAAEANERVTKSFEEMRQQADDVRESINDFYREVQESSNKTAATNSQLEDYKNTIDRLGGKAKVGTTEMAELQIAVSGVNEICGTNYYVDDETGSIKEQGKEAAITAGEIDDLVESKKRLLKVEALQEQLKSAYSKQAEAQDAMNSAQTNYDNADAIYQEKKKAYDKWAREHPNSGRSYNTSKEYRDMYDAQVALNEAKKSLDECTDSYDECTDAVGRWDAMLVDATKDEQLHDNAIRSAINANEEMKNTLSGLGVDIDGLSMSLTQAGVTTEEWGNITPDVLNDIVAKYGNSTADIMHGLADFTADSDEEWAKALNAAVSWSNGLSDVGVQAVQAVAAITGKSAAEIGQFAEQAGVQGDDAMQAFATAIQAGGSLAVSAASAASGMTLDEFRAHASEYGISGDEQMEAYANALNAHKSDVYAAAIAISGVSLTEFESATVKYGIAGDDATMRFAQALRDNGGDVEAAAASVADSAQYPIDGAADDIASSDGGVSGMADGMAASAPQVEAQADVIKGKVKGIDQSSKSFLWGQHLVSNLANGMNDKKPALTGVVESIASVISSRLHQTTADIGPLRYTDQWGGHLVDNIINGMSDRERALARQAASAAEAISSNFAPDVQAVASAEFASAYASEIATRASAASQTRTLNVSFSGVTLNGRPDIENVTQEYLEELVRLMKQ